MHRVVVFIILAMSITSVFGQENKVVKFPQYPGTEYYFDLMSSASGICQAIGYAAGVSGSVLHSRSLGLVLTVHVSQSGQVEGSIEYDYPVSSVECSTN